MFVGVETSGAQYGPSALQDALRIGRRQGGGFVLDDTAPSVMEPNEIITVGRTRAHRGANRRVETRAVTSTSQQAYTHRTPLRAAFIKSVVKRASGC